MFYKGDICGMDVHPLPTLNADFDFHTVNLYRTSLDSTYLIKKRHQVNWANLKPSIRYKKAATSATQPIIFSGATWRKNNPKEKTLLPSLKLTAVST